jgi:precorrin-6B methylase 2
LGFLKREGLLESAKYSNTPDTHQFLDKNKSTYMGGILAMANSRMYPSWGNLGEGLRTGLPQSEVKNGGLNIFEELYKSPAKLEEFVHAMTGIQVGNFISFAKAFDFSKYSTLADVGGSGAMLSVMVAKHQPHMKCISFDLPQVESIAQGTILRFEMGQRVKTANGDFFKDALPKADMIVMGNILHDWDEQNKMFLMKKAYEALPVGGAFVAIENIIDNERNKNAFGLLMSLNMLIETGQGFDYTLNDFERWAKDAGFKKTVLLPLAGSSSAAIAYK